MSKTKFYAAKTDNGDGIFTDWEKCRAFLNGKKGISYKSFHTENEAHAFIRGEDIYAGEVDKNISEGFVTAYTDGSYEQNAEKYAYGAVIIDLNKEERLLSGTGNYAPFLSSRNVAGEVEGVLAALKWAFSHGRFKIKIYHDYNGLSYWADGDWKAESPIAAYYKGELDSRYKGIIDYRFVKVKGHSNNVYNEKVDKIAKAALFENKILTDNSAYSFLVNGITEENLDFILENTLKQNSEIKITSAVSANYVDYFLVYGCEKLGMRHFTDGKLAVFSDENLRLYVIFITFVIAVQNRNSVPLLIKEAMGLNTKSLNLKERDIYGFRYFAEAFLSAETENYAPYIFPMLAGVNFLIKKSLSEAKINYGKITSLFIGGGGNYVFGKEYDFKGKETVEKAYNLYVKYRKDYFSYSCDKRKFDEIVTEFSEIDY